MTIKGRLGHITIEGGLHAGYPRSAQLFAFLTRRKAVALIWQYLDGAIPQDRFDLLDRVIQSNRWVRQQYIDCAVLNALLSEYFNPTRYTATPAIPQPSGDFACESCNIDLDAELDAIEREEYEREQRESRERRSKRTAG